MSQATSCEYEIWAGSFFDPPEFCPNDVDPEYGEGRWCTDHLPPPEPEYDDEHEVWFDDFEGDIE